MKIYTQTEIETLHSAELSTVASATYEAPELGTRLTSEITAKRAEITALKRNKPATKAAYFGQLETLGIELQTLIDADVEIRTQNDTSVAEAKTETRETAETQTLARINTVNGILRESDWIIAVDSQISDSNLMEWVEYRADLRAWAVGDSETIPDSPTIPDIDPESETVLSRIASQDDAILGVLEMML